MQRDLPQGEELNTELDAAAGLTRFEAEGAYSLSIVRHGNIRPDAIWELKSQTLKKSGLLQLYRGGERFDGLGGLQSLKSVCLRAMRRQGHNDPLRRPRGTLLLGVPGTGKSASAKALSTTTAVVCRSLVASCGVRTHRITDWDGMDEAGGTEILLPR